MITKLRKYSEAFFDLGGLESYGFIISHTHRVSFLFYSILFRFIIFVLNLFLILACVYRSCHPAAAAAASPLRSYIIKSQNKHWAHNIIIEYHIAAFHGLVAGGQADRLAGRPLE